MKQSQKTTVTLSMLWIGLMAFASQPGWVRNVISFVTGKTTSTVVDAGGTAGSGNGSSLTP